MYAAVIIGLWREALGIKCRIGMLMVMVLILDGNSELVAHVRSNFRYQTCLRHLIRTRAVTIGFFFSPKRSIFLHACETCSELPSDIITMAGGIEFKD